MILSLGFKMGSIKAELTADHIPSTPIASVDEAILENLLSSAGVLVIGPNRKDYVREIQKIYAADKHLSVILLTEPAQIKHVKQVVLFAPNLGNNTLVVALNPELNLGNICKSAITKTIQKRSFYKINLAQELKAGPVAKIKLAQMGAFLEYAPIAAILISDTDRIINYNQQAKRLFPALEFLEEDIVKFLPPSEAETIRSFIHSEHPPGITKEFGLQEKILQLSASVVYTEEGQRHFLLLFNDVTSERKETERIQLILEALPQMAWTSNAEGLLTYFTQGWYFYTGQSPREALGDGWRSVIFPEDLPILTEQWKLSLSSGRPLQHGARYKKNNGEYRWHLARATAIRNNGGEIIMWVGTCTDIHDQVLLTEELERKVKERTHLLEISNSELEQFAHVSSHDLQEPLRKIKTFAELLKEHVYENIDDTSKRYLDKIRFTAERMSNSLKALLNYTRLHREEKFIPVNLNDVISHVLVDLELLVAQKKAVVNFDVFPTVKAVPIQMQQLFYNLINNALKFSKRDVAPIIKITSRRLMEEELVKFKQLQRFREYYEIVVTDNGIGFDQNYAHKIFIIFQRLHNKSEYDGTGIGLSLVKKVVNNHGGEIFVTSTPGIGSSFHVILPG